MLLLQKILRKLPELSKNILSWIWNNKLLVLCLLALSLQFFSIQRLSKENRSLEETNSTLILPDSYKEAENKVANLEKTNKDLKNVIQYLESKEETVRYITRTKTVLEGQEVVYKTLPASYTYKLSNGLPVAYFQASEESSDYLFITYDLVFKSDIIISDESTVGKVTATSSQDISKVYELPLEITTIKNSHGSKEEEKENSILKPRLTLGIGASVPFTGPEVILSMPIIEGPKQKISWLAPSISFSETPKIGIIPVLYNVAKPLPLVDNIWLGLGYESDFVHHYLSVSLNAKL